MAGSTSLGGALGVSDNWKVTGAGTCRSPSAGSGAFSKLVAGSSLQVGGGTKIKCLASAD